MKKIISMMLIMVVLAISVPAIAENSGGMTTVTLDGARKELVAYNIYDNNYFKLRDIANLLKDTNACFDVQWNESAGAVEITSGVPYSTDEPITDAVLNNPTAVPSYSPIYKDGGRVLLKAYRIGDNNFFKLRDLAAVLDFGVDWSEESGIMINSSAAYSFPPVSGFAVNPETMLLIGKTKAEIDQKYGQGDYIMEFGLVDYNNGIMMGYNSLGGYPQDNQPAETMYVTMDKLFNNCPDILSPELIASAFDHSCTAYDEMDGENIICVNYCGVSICFPLDWNSSKDDSVLVNIYNPYFSDVEGIPLATMAQEHGSRDFVGYYVDEETQSHFTLTLRTEGWTAELYLVRVLNGNYVCKIIDDYTMVFSDEWNGDYELKWSKDYKDVVLTSLEYGTQWYFKAW